MKRILRVFPRRTSATPDDDLVVVGDPLFWEIEAEEVHVSVTFTWDIEEGRRLQRSWEKRHGAVKIGGPAFGFGGVDFTPGLYLKEGATITSRGCTRSCDHCSVSEREGKLCTLSIHDGFDIFDNNLLACPRAHVEAVMEMLSRQRKAARFTGGIDARLVRPWWTKLLSRIRTEILYTAYDSPDQKQAIEKAIPMLLEAGLTRREIACYVLVGYDDDTMAEAEKRLRLVQDLGAMPFLMYYQPKDAKQRGLPPKSWGSFVKQWTRPRIITARIKHEKMLAQQKDSSQAEKVVESEANQAQAQKTLAFQA